MTSTKDNDTVDLRPERRFWRMNEEDPVPFFESTNADLECDECKDESLYHDSHAWAHETTKKLLCVKCYNELKEPERIGFKAVVTYH